MKKIIYLVAPLMLASCNGPTPSQDVKFLIQESSVILNDKTIVIHLDWEPSSDVIEFSNFTFTLKNQSSVTSTVTPKDVSARPLELTSTFDQALENDDTGNLKFHYNDKTINKEGDGSVNDILIKLDEPSKDVEFFIEESSLILENQSATIHLDYHPSSDVITFANFNFALKNQSSITSNVVLKEATSRPLELIITFNSELSSDDVGELTFHYNDQTIKKEGEGKVSDINVKLPTYLEKPIKTVVSDTDGNVTETTHEYDELYRPIKVETKKYEEGQLTKDTIAQYTYNDHDDITHYILTIDEVEEINITDTYDYDKNGNMILDQSQGSYYGEIINSEDYYEYDELNRITLHECSSADTLEAELETIARYEYSYTEGKQYQEFEKEEYYDYYVDPSGLTLCEITNQTFDNKGDLLTTVTLDKDNNKISEITYTFDEYHCMTHCVSEIINFSKSIYSATYYKNNPDKPLNTTDIWYDGEQLFSTDTITYTYDSHDRIKKEVNQTQYSDASTKTATTEYFYEIE